MKCAIGLILAFGIGIAVGAGLVLDGVHRLRQANAAVRADCAALEPRIAALETAPKCVQVKTDTFTLDIYPAPTLGTRPKVAKQ